jgi:hypothetical protein
VHSRQNPIVFAAEIFLVGCWGAVGGSASCSRFVRALRVGRELGMLSGGAHGSSQQTQVYRARTGDSLVTPRVRERQTGAALVQGDPGNHRLQRVDSQAESSSQNCVQFAPHRGCGKFE